ncbi:MAG: valine--tRNA ligase [Flavobacteriales bacterium]
MEIPSKYNPKDTEDKWYKFWLENNYFHSEPDDREPYTVVIPPPNVTGVLHMGHMLNNTIQDVLVRRARMLGKNACWVPGTDHASIATEAKVVKRLREKGIKKSDIGRDEFMKHAWEWKEEFGGIILEQLKKLGASCDWERTSFTMDQGYSADVESTFIRLYEKGLIYRGERMINWDPAALTALSDEEVIHKDVNSKLYHVRYKITDSEEYVTIATTRPETILGDSAICIHPDDTRYTHLHGKKAIVPLVGREIPIILDDYVDIEFGTGCLKVTPAHDVNDFDLGAKHNLEIINIMNANGTLNENSVLYNGVDRFKVRKLIQEDLDKAGALVEVEPYKNKIGYSERTDVVIEPRLSLQWWVKMEELVRPALQSVSDGEIKFYPEKFVNTYNHWLNNIKDWCISRQLWWGHRIPAWFYGEEEDDFVVAKTEDEALQKARTKSGNSDLSSGDLKQDEDVMDTWFSSWLWPISVFDGMNSDAEVDYYYPTADLVTGPDIIFFWVARMIMAGYELRDEKPFSNVYFTGIVRDEKGRKMSKSLGNSPDPLELIEKYGADGVRVGLLLTAPAGNDIPFDSKLCETGRNFSSKVWNAFRLVKMWEVEEKPMPETSKIAIEWMTARIGSAMAELNDSFSKFRLSEALMSTYKLIRDDFSSSYLEAIKPAYGEKIDKGSYDQTLEFFETMVKLIHPFMPFLSEEVWQRLADRTSPEQALIISEWPVYEKGSELLQREWEVLTDILTEVRNQRNSYGISPKELLIGAVNISGSMSKDYSGLLLKLGNCEIDLISDGSSASPRKNGVVALELGDKLQEEEKKNLEKELEYTKGFMTSVQKKLSNERFVNNAPEQVVAAEQKKLSDAEAKVKQLEEKLAKLN